MAQYAIRLVAYDADGNRLQVLPDVLELDLSAKLNADSTLKFKYAADGVGADLFTARYYTVTLLEIAVEVSGDGGMTWAEPPIGRFIVTNGDTDLLDTGVTQVEVSTQANSTRLSDTVLLLPKTPDNQDASTLYVDANLKAHFHHVTPGYLIRTLWSSSAGRLWGTDLTRTFTATTDSAGQAWSTDVSVSLAAGTTLRSALDQLASSLLVDWRMEGREVCLYNPSPTASDSGVMGPVLTSWTLPLGTGLTAAEESYSWADQCSRVIVEGEESKTWTVTNPYLTGQVKQGLAKRFREVYVKAQGVEDELGARRVAEPYFLKGATVQETLKRSFRASDMEHVPFVDFNVGSWVLLERQSGMALIRVQGISLSWDGITATGDLTLGTAKDSVLTKLLTKTLAADENGIRTSGGTPTNASTTAVSTEAKQAVATAKEAKDIASSGGQAGDGGSKYSGIGFGTITPSPPVLTLADFYGDNDDLGNYFGYCRVTWTHDGKNYDGSKTLVDNEPQMVAAFVYHRIGEPGSYSWQYWSPSYTEWRGLTGGTITGLDAGETYRVFLRAYYVGGWSADSNSITGTVALDSTPPPTPSAPTVQSAYQAMQITWDGLAADGSSGAPVDFSHLGIAVVPEGGALREMYTTDGPAGRVLTLANLAQDTYDIAIRSYDLRGNVSAWSNRVTASVTVTVDARAIQDAVDNAMSAYDDSIGAAINFAAGIQNLASDMIVYGDWPPDEGTAGVSYWRGPDGKVWKLNTLVTE